MKPKQIVGALLFALIATTPAFAKSGDRYEATVWADVTVAADGHVTAATIPDEKLARGKIAAFLLPRINTWQFVPARHNGVAVEAQTSLEIKLDVREQGNEFAVAVLGASPSPRFVKTVPPRYPADAIRRHIQGVVNVGFTVQPDGSVADVVALEGSEKDLVAPTIEAVKQWTLKPEIVDGIAVATKATTPVRYEIRGYGAKPPKRARTLDGSAAQELVAESNVKLKGDVADRAL